MITFTILLILIYVAVWFLIPCFVKAKVWKNDPARIGKLLQDAKFFEKYNSPEWTAYCHQMVAFLQLPFLKKMFTKVPNLPSRPTKSDPLD